ncbi:hypothetical protein A3D14_01575 [Candidatus Saccharibacteria bacterium RIFCSPHIGHO2_02_FULL_47_12]|nr:MAG: hypothetical protein A3D14_01575 [Candidatus Saccharibacteria bacterium RIFCSPHIGHO2_02_FULL_47_12]
MSERQQKPFSEELRIWLKSHEPKTLERLSQVFEEKSFAVLFLILLAVPALPIPTGGITHVFEVIAMVLALELIIGRKTLWMPRRWSKLKIAGGSESKVVPYILRRVRWFERYAKPRLSELLAHPLFLRITGVVIFCLSLAAFLAPPFSGLDTLPALGVVIISLALILEDAALYLVGLLIGALGVGLEIGLSTLVLQYVGSQL